MLGFFVTALDVQVVNVALPAVGRSLEGDLAGLQWVVTGYTLTYSTLLLFAGTLADRLGARRAYGAGMVLFVAASAGCGIAPTLGVLVAARLAQGAGAAVVAPTSMALIREGFAEPAARARAVALWAVGGSVAAGSGPIVGGLLTRLDWRLIFFVNVPVGIAALVVLARVGRSPRRPTPFDVRGQLSAVTALAALTYVVIEGNRLGWTSPTALAILVLAVLATSGFLRAQSTGRQPMVPLHVFGSRPVQIALAAGFTSMAGFYGVVFVQGLYFQQVRGASAVTTGLLFVPMTGTLTVSNLCAARVAARFGDRAPIVAGLLVQALGLCLLVALPDAAPTWAVALAMVPVGAGGAFPFPAIVALVLDHAPPELAGTASGVLNTFRQLGGALGVAALGAVLAAQAPFAHGLHVGLTATAVLLAATAAFAFRLEAHRR
jgi:DHA2 family methylenomycin A resistance protein-like MFS transporter